MTFKEGQICLIEDFQDFGNVLFLLNKRCTKNIYGGKLSNPIWEGLIVDVEDGRLRDASHYRLSNNIVFTGLSFENKLVTIGEKDDS